MCFLCRSIWLHLTSGLLYQLWIELRLSIGIFRFWFSHWRSFHQAGLLNACWVPWDTWSVFKGSSWTTRKEKQKQLCTEALLLWRDLTESSAELAWHPGCLGLCPSRPVRCSFWPFLLWETVDASWTLWAWIVFSSPETQARKTSGGFPAASCSPLLLKLPQWICPPRESRNSINK